MLALSAHMLLGITAYRLFLFLMGSEVSGIASAGRGWWFMDAVLVFQFASLHSLLLFPGTRKRWERMLPGALYGSFFTLITCVSLLLMVLAWKRSPVLLWKFEGQAGMAVRVAYLLSWVGLFYSVALTGLGFQTGWTPFWAWVRGHQPPRRRHEERGAYRLLRHPVYLCFLGHVWFTPVMSSDRALLTILLTVYIFIGSYLKDRRLVFYLGQQYREYQARVPGYPLGLGPLGRVRLAQDSPKR